VAKVKFFNQYVKYHSREIVKTTKDDSFI